jgi:solute:Na+ symporter, SSS family
MLLAFIMIYLLATIGIGWWASKNVKTTADFVVAGRSLPLFVVACSLFATWFGSETVMGASAEFVEGGILGVIEDPFGSALCLFLCGLLVARPLYRLNMLTFSDYFRLRYSRVAEIVSAIFMIPSYFSWIAAQLVAMSIVLHVVEPAISREAGVLISISVVVIYTYVGGMWSVSVTDVIQTVSIVLGMLVLAVDLFAAAGGWQGISAAVPPKFFNFLPENKPIHWLEWFAAWITIGLGSIPQQDVFQRVMSAKDEKTAVRASYLSAFMYLTVAFLPLMIAFCGGLIVYPELLGEGRDPQMLLPSMVLQHFGLGMQILFFGALLSAILSTCSGAILAPATVVGENLIKPFFKNISDKNLLKTMRYSIVGIAIICAIMAISRDNIYDLVGESSALSLVSLFIPLIFGLYWKKSTAFGAILSQIIGMIAWLIGLWYFPESEKFMAMLAGLAASFLAMIFGSLFSKKKGQPLQPPLY